MEVYKAIGNVCARMSSEGISKDRKNTQQGYNFRGIDQVLNSLSGALVEAGLVILPRCVDRTVTERETKSGGALFYVVCKVEFDLVSITDGSKHTVTTYGEAMDSADKATNKAMSAAYKYLALLTFCIPTESLPDNDADHTTHDVKSSNEGRLAARNRWLDEQFAAINATKTIGELKRIVEEAVSIAASEDDKEAAEMIKAAGMTKAQAAKTKEHA